MRGMRVRYLVAVGLVSLAAAVTALGENLEFVFDQSNFTNPTNINNDYWPVTSLGSAVYVSEADDGCEVSHMMVSGMFSDFDGEYQDLIAVEVTDREWVDEECAGEYVLAESTSDWYGQDDFGNVWYFGEDTVAWDDEEDCLSGGGSWKAGTDGAVAGVVILGSPFAGASYQQEFFEGEAEDMAKVLRLNAAVETEIGSFEGCMVTKEYTPLSPGEIEHKFYCRLSQGGYGLTLVNELNGKTRRVEYAGMDLPPGDFPDEFPTNEACAE